MTFSVLFSVFFILLFFSLILLYAGIERKSSNITLRELPAINNARRKIFESVEAGTRLHISIGRGGLIGKESSSAFMGLKLVESLTVSTAGGDFCPIITTGNPLLAILAKDIQKEAYQDISQLDQFEPTSVQLSGVTPFSYSAGGMEVISAETTSVNVLSGSFGVEVALLADSSERSGSFTLGGTEDISAQSVLCTTTNESLIGEELYAVGAYLDGDYMHRASLRAQDAIRWILIIFILGGMFYYSFGLDQKIMKFLGNLL
jgi:hypothetical protein